MARRNSNDQQVQLVVQQLLKMPKGVLIALALLVGVGFFIYKQGGAEQQKRNPAIRGEVGTYLLCSWNVENFYDDQNDSKNSDDLEDWFGNNPAMFTKKVDHLCRGLLMMNEGIGPDIIAMVEVESMRCMEALRDALNAKLNAAGHADKKYETVLFVGDNTGRRFAPGILSRLPAINDRTRKLGKRGNGRILEGHLDVNGHELVVISAHWTSRVTDKDGEGDRRMSYAQDCYGRVRAILTESPDADVIVCGDFNDEFTDKSLQEGLNVSRSIDTVKQSTNEPKLYALLADWNGDPKGTLYGKGKWSIFDHLCVTRGLLDEQGWKVQADTASIFAPKEFRTGRAGLPFRFGDEKTPGERGFADHFPVVVRLNVAATP
jgi:endonuclease/exonuclease/phosphatase family metal-dependent hydrolase